MADDSVSLGKMLRNAREAKQISTRDLSARVNTTHGYIAKLERGEKLNPKPELLQRIADVVDLDINKLLPHIGLRANMSLPPLNTYFRRKLGVNADEAAILEGLIEDYQKQHNRKEESNDKDAN